MVEELLDNKKLIAIPKPLANELYLVAGRLGTNVPNFATEALTQALRVEQLGSDLKEAVDLFHMNQIHRGAGLVLFQRVGFNELLSKLYLNDPEKILDLWYSSGRWYSAYLSVKLNADILVYLEKDLLISWNLDESEIQAEDVVVTVRLTSFGMSRLFTDLLVMYTRGVFEELGYEISDEDVLPGLISFRFLKRELKLNTIM
jgi:hypothetical protein